MAKRLEDSKVCALHDRGRTVNVAGAYICPDCLDEDLAARQEIRAEAEKEAD